VEEGMEVVEEVEEVEEVGVEVESVFPGLYF